VPVPEAIDDVTAASLNAWNPSASAIHTVTLKGTPLTGADGGRTSNLSTAPRQRYSGWTARSTPAYPSCKSGTSDGIPVCSINVLRVVTLADMRTIHNAFPDRRFVP